MKFEFINSGKNGVQFNFFTEIGVVQQLRLLGTGGILFNQVICQFICTISLSSVGAGRAERLFGKIWLQC